MLYYIFVCAIIGEKGGRKEKGTDNDEHDHIICARNANAHKYSKEM